MSHRRSTRKVRRQRPRKQRPLALLLLLAAGALATMLLRGDLGAGPGLVGRNGEDGAWATVATDVLNVRTAPGTDAAIVDAYPSGQRVEVLGPARDGFVPVRHGSGRAWIAVAYLAFDGADPPLAALPVGNAAAAAAPPAAGESREAPAPPPDPVTDEEPGPAAPVERWIDIDRGTATVTLYEGDRAIAAFAGRIGRDPAPDGFYSTAVGTYHVYSLNQGLAPTPFAEDTYLTHWVGFDPVRKNGIHSPVRDAEGNVKPWQNPTTLGCVRLAAADAETVFAFARIGMRVEVHD